MQTVAPNPVFNSIQQPKYVSPQGNLQNTQVPAGKDTQKQSFGGTVADSFIDVGKTVAGGVAVGAVSGGLVSLLPFDNTELVTASLHDTILDAARESDTLPEELKNAAEPFNLAKGLLGAQEDYRQIQIKELLLKEQLNLAEALDDNSIRNTISELSEKLKNAGIDLKGTLPDDTLDSNALEALKTDWLLKITEAINKNTSTLDDAAKNAAMENIINAKNNFIEGIKKFIKEAPAGDTLLSSAKTQAKIASAINLTGKAISFAVMIALITKLFDILQPKKGKKGDKTAQTQAQQAPQTQVQTGGNVWNMFAQSVAQGPAAPQNSFNKFMTLG